MSESCRQFCPVAEQCIVQYETLQETKSFLEQTQIIIEERRHRALEAFEMSSLDAAMEEEVTGHPVDAKSPLAERRNQDENCVRLLGEVADRYALEHLILDHDLNQADAAVAMLDDAQHNCAGPKLSLPGKILYMAGKATNQLLPSRPLYRYSHKENLYRKGYVKCCQPLAKAALKSMHSRYG